MSAVPGICCEWHYSNVIYKVRSNTQSNMLQQVFVACQNVHTSYIMVMHKHTHTHVGTHSCTHTHTHTCTHTHVHTHTRTYTYTHTHAHTHTHIHTCTLTHTRYVDIRTSYGSYFQAFLNVGIWRVLNSISMM